MLWCVARGPWLGGWEWHSQERWVVRQLLQAPQRPPSLQLRPVSQPAGRGHLTPACAGSHTLVVPLEALGRVKATEW